MRWGLLIVLGAVLTGCTAKQPQTVVNAPSPIYDEAVAAALVYDPPVTVNGPRLDVSREGRSASAFAGFEEVITTFYYLRMDDYQQSNGRQRYGDRFEREAITERVGVSYR